MTNPISPLIRPHVPGQPAHIAQQQAHVATPVSTPAASEPVTPPASPSAASVSEAINAPVSSEQIHATKMQIANSILASHFKLKEATCDYDKKFLLEGLSLNYEYLGRVELSKMQQDMQEAAQAASAGAQTAAAATTASEQAASTAASETLVTPAATT